MKDSHLNTSYDYDQVDELIFALEELVKLQAHYAGLLNVYDGGNRKRFKSAKEWIEKLRERNK